MDNNNYIVKSLELHLFFGRIMKEHSLFLRAGFTPANANFSNKAEYFKKEFEKLLSDAVTLSEGIISHNLLCSGELVTEFTLPAEKTTEAFTGIGINKGITARELRLVRDCRQGSIGEGLRCKVQRLNRRALEKQSCIGNMCQC